jgi:hypothetical protein
MILSELVEDLDKAIVPNPHMNLSSDNNFYIPVFNASDIYYKDINNAIDQEIDISKFSVSDNNKSEDAIIKNKLMKMILKGYAIVKNAGDSTWILVRPVI